MKRIRFGLIGLGRHGQRYARHLAAGDVPGATLSHVWTRDADKAARIAAETGARAAPSAQALCAADVDAVVIAVPAGLHLELARAAAAHRRPLLVEKPLARTAAEGEAIVEAFRAAGAPLMVAQTLRFDPLLRALREAATTIGPIQSLSFEQRLEPRGLAWEDDPELSGGGVLLQSAIHTVDAVRFVTEPAEARLTHAVRERHHYARNEDLALLQFELTGGDRLERTTLADVRVSKVGHSRHMRFAVHGFDAGLEADFIDRMLYRTEGRTRTARPVPEAPTVVEAARAFAAHVRDEAENPVPGEEGLAALRIVQAALHWNPAQR